MLPAPLLIACISLLVLVFTNLAAAVTFSAAFERNLGERLATLSADAAAYPGLRFALVGFPTDVPSWAAKTRSECATELRVFSTTQKSDVKRLLASDPANADKISKYGKDATDFVEFFFAGIRTEDVVNAATTRPATKAPPKASVSPSDGSGSAKQHDEVVDRTEPVPWPVYTTPTLPTSTPMPHVVYKDIHISPTIKPWQIILFVAAGISLVLTMIHWHIKRQAKRQKAREEEDAAVPGEAGEINHATFVVIAAADADKTTVKPQL